MSAIVSLGSNLGDREAHLRAAVALLGARFPLVAVSAVYESDPVGFTDQPSFLNQIVVLETSDAEAVLAAAHEAEETRARLRSTRWGPRTLDVDVVSVDGVVRSDPRLTLPHPRAHERAFVLVPWLDVDPDAELPGRGPVRVLARGLGTSGVRRWRG